MERKHNMGKPRTLTKLLHKIFICQKKNKKPKRYISYASINIKGQGGNNIEVHEDPSEEHTKAKLNPESATNSQACCPHCSSSKQQQQRQERICPSCLFQCP